MADKSDKTEKPTPKKKKEARQKGNIARTPELSSWLAVLVATFAVPLEFKVGISNLRTLVADMTVVIREPDQNLAVHMLGKGLETAALSVLPLALTMMAVGVVANVAQVGFAMTTHGLKPNFKKLNPFQGIKRLFSPRSLWELGKNVFKFTILGLVTWRTLKGLVPALMQPGPLTLGMIVGLAAAKAVTFVRTVAATGFVIAASDWAIQKRRINKSLMMTKQELKEEAKQSEGNPLIKGAIRRKMVKMSRLRMMAEVSRADAVIVNPTHYAVAICYEAAKGAPRVIAKGTDELALRIRQEAELHGVPVVEDIPLARTLWRVCEIGAEIPLDLYEAVARLLAFVYSLGRQGSARPLGGGILRVPAGALR